MSGPLTAREVEIVTFERQWFARAGSKEQAIRTLFDLSATRYYQLLNALLDDARALEHDPVTVHRLRRLREARRQRRRVNATAPRRAPRTSDESATA